MRKIILLISSMIISIVGVNAQTLSTETFSSGNANLPSIGSNFNVPINANSIGTNILSMTFYFEYDSTVIQNTGYSNSQFPSGVDIIITKVDPNIMKVEIAAFGSLLTVSDGKVLDLNFDFSGGDSPLDFQVVGDTYVSQVEYLVEGTFDFTASDVTNGSVNGGNVTNTITSGAWATELNWSQSVVPNSFHDVVIESGSKGLVNLISNVSARSVTIKDGGQFTQSSGSTLNVTNDFIIESGGSFIQNGTVNATNKIAERSVAAYTTNDDGWHLLSSPVASQDIDGTAFEPVDGSDDFYMWDETAATNPWINHDQGGFSSFSVGAGYLVAYNPGKTLEFTGDFNTSDVTGLSVTNSGANSSTGFNLLGNPYPSALEWNTGDWTLGNVQTTAYVWDESGKSYNPIGANDAIPAMNGFMVYTIAAETLTIPEAARIHDATDWYKDEEQKIELVAHDPSNESAQQHIIKFSANATVDYDLQHDAVYMSGYAPQFYSHGGGKALMVNTLPSLSSETVIPLTFNKNEGAEYVIELAENTTGEEVFLRDMKMNKTIALSDIGLYEFTAEEGDSPERFKLQFYSFTTGDDAFEADAISAYVSEKTLVIENLKTQADVRVFNLSGQLMHRFDAEASSRTEERLNIQSGIYMVHIRSGKDVITSKVFVK